jgi:YD repeat-containing protein
MEYTDLNNGASNDLAVKPSKLHVFKSTNPVSEAQLNEATTGNPARYTDLIPNSNYFEHEFSYEYDQASGNLVQTEKVDDLPDAYIWDQGQTRPVAKVINAEASQIAYTSFEDVLDQGTQYDGNWEINNIPGGGWSNATGNQFRGDKSFNLSPYAGGRTITKRNLPAGEYTISFWYKNANIDIQGISQPSSTSGANSTWKRYEAIVTIAAGQNITLSSSGNSRIDELRLYPKGAFMTSYVYTDRGQIRSVSDANDVSNTMEYDDFGRLTIIRDQDGNIVEKTDYHYKNQ